MRRRAMGECGGGAECGDGDAGARWPRAGSTTSWRAGSIATRVDERWVVPHFEKMLYDNTELLTNYVHAFQSFR